MTGPQLPAEIAALVQGGGPVSTVAHVEVLLAVRACQPGGCTLAQVAASTSVTTADGALQCLRSLVAAGLVERAGADVWRYAPRTSALHHAVDQLATAYDERPVALLRALYERPARSLQSFADAFRLRADDPTDDRTDDRKVR